MVESSLALLSGLFPPTPSQVWSNSSELATQWQPIAVEMASPEKCYVIGETADCPVADKIYKTFNDLPQIKQFWQEKQEFVTRFNLHSNLNYTRWDEFAFIYDILLCGKGYFGDTFVEPTWIDKVGNDTWQQMKEFRELSFRAYGWLGHKFLRLKAGSFLKEIVTNMKKIASDIDKGTQEKQLRTYGSHDTVISMILHSLGVFKGKFAT